MRRVFIFLFCIVLVNLGLIFAQSVQRYNRRSENKVGSKTITIGFIGKTDANPVFSAANAGTQLAAKELGEKYKIDVMIDVGTPDKENDEEQANEIKRLTLSGAAGIAIACSNDRYLTSFINETVDRGIPVLCFDTDAPQSKRFAYYGADNIAFGKALLRQLAAEINGKGMIAVLAGNKYGLNQKTRLQGVKEELNKYPGITLPENNIFYNIEVGNISAEVVRREQEKNPNIVGWAFLDSWVLQSSNPFKWKPGEVKVVAGNAIQVELDFVKSGYVQSLVGINYFDYGYKAVEILLNKIVKDKTPGEPLIYCPLTPVTRKNVNEWSLKWNDWQ